MAISVILPGINYQSHSMKILYSALVCTSLFLQAGCATVTTTKQASQVIRLLGEREPEKGKLETMVEDKSYGVQNLAAQVLGITSKTREKKLDEASVRYEKNETEPVPRGLAQDPVVKKLVESQITGGEATFGAGELKQFATDFFKTMEDPYDEHQTSLLVRAGKEGRLAFGNLMTAYFMACQKGNFVLRDGTVLGKPKATVKLTDGKISGSVDNDTLVGLLTVFYEALYDYGLATPVYYQTKKGEATYKEEYKESPAGSGEYVKVYKKQDPQTEKDFLVGGKAPTAAAFFEERSLVEDYGRKSPADNRDFTVKEFQFVRYCAGLAADRSKGLSGLIVRSRGSVDAGMFVIGSFSVGNNETLAKVVETSLASASGRLTEQGLLKAFGRYRGDKSLVNELLDHYKELYEKISKLDK
jgi:hypothetical protein